MTCGAWGQGVGWVGEGHTAHPESPQSAGSAAHALIFFASGLVWIEPGKIPFAELLKQTFDLQTPRWLEQHRGLTVCRYLLQSPCDDFTTHRATH